MRLADYRAYRDLPVPAGLCSFADAARPGLSVEASVQRLKRHHWAFRRLHEIFVRRLTGEAVYELKMGSVCVRIIAQNTPWLGDNA